MDRGLHPTLDGYGKIADFGTTPCRYCVTKAPSAVDKDTLIDIENIVGTDLNDTLVGYGATSSKLVLAVIPSQGSW